MILLVCRHAHNTVIQPQLETSTLRDRMAESFIEKFAQKLRIIPNLDRDYSDGKSQELRKFPSPDEWLNFKELDANAWPVRVEKNYSSSNNLLTVNQPVECWLMSTRIQVK